MNVLFSDDAVRASSPVTDGGTGGGGGGGGSDPTPKPSESRFPGFPPDPGEGASERIDRFIRIARSKLGCRYVRGGKGPNVFDCSRFCILVHQQGRHFAGLHDELHVAQLHPLSAQQQYQQRQTRRCNRLLRSRCNMQRQVDNDRCIAVQRQDR